MQYTGEDCSATHHSQDPSKVNCDGDPNYDSNVWIRATDKSDFYDCSAKVWFEGWVLVQGLDLKGILQPDEVREKTEKALLLRLA
jgi:hypothetical protein